MNRPIAISLSPNSQKDDVLLALKVFLSPWRWRDEKEVGLLVNKFVSLFGENYQAFAVNAGRSAEYLILKALGIGKGDEVIVQAFTCVAVPNSVLWIGARPIYVDIGSDFNININDLKKKITKNTKAIIIQHTFGTPAKVDEVKRLIKGKKIILIEDGCHGLGAKYNDQMVGTLGDIAFFSFGRDKVLSSVFGGMILCSDKKLNKKLEKLINDLDEPSYRWIGQQLFHPIAFNFILPVYNIFGGKYLLFLFQKLGLLSKAIYKEEKETVQPSVFPLRMPGALALLASKQLDKLVSYNLHRKKIANFYFKNIRSELIKIPKQKVGAIWLRFPLLVNNPEIVIKKMKTKGILLGDWYKEVVVPVNNLKKVYYIEGSCPIAEDISKHIVNLPTYPTFSKKDAKYVLENLIKCLN